MEIRGRRFTSANQALRKIFQLYANVRPAKYLEGSPAKFPGTDLVVIRTLEERQRPKSCERAAGASFFSVEDWTLMDLALKNAYSNIYIYIYLGELNRAHLIRYEVE